MFWDYVEKAKAIYNLELKFNALNINLGGSDIRESIKKLSDEFNNDEIEIKLKNKNGNLKIAKESVGNFIEYITLLGGKYRLVFKTNNGVRKAIDSMTNIIKLRFLKNIQDENPETVSDKLKKLSEQNDE